MPAHTRNPSNDTDRAEGPVPFPIVGIGASAGGLDAFSQLLAELPTDTGMAFVLVQHLDPHHDSQLGEILTRTTKMPVVEAAEGARAEPDHVYVIAPNVSLTIREGVFRLAPREARSLHLPIDLLFHSLAAERRSRSIGIVLSGTGADGSEGIRSIKAAGGIAFAQEPTSARQAAMPLAAIETGVVDYVLTPAGIAGELARISRHPYLLDAATPLESGDEESLQSILAALREATRVDFRLYRETTIRRRIARRMALRRQESLAEYAELLQREPSEVVALYEDVLIHVTSFFRDPEIFEVLKRDVFPKILASVPEGESIRIWVPGCSTGQEPYSLAIALIEFLDHAPRQRTVQIFASDIGDKASLDRARVGLYPRSIEADVSRTRLARFFVEEPGGYRVTRTLRDLCVFAHHDVGSDPPFSRLDLISCRNVLIYLGPRLQERVMPTFHYSLNPGGFLLLGSSETIGSHAALFEPVDKQSRIFARRAVPGRASALFAEQRERPVRGPARVEPVPSMTSIQQEADRLMLTRFAPAGVLINGNHDVLQLRGPIAQYLELPQGVANLNLMRMARPGLGFELRSLFAEARARGGPVQRKGVQVRERDRTREVEIDVVPITAAGGGDACYLVVFQEAAAPMARSARGADDERGEIEDLERELDAAHAQLQSLVEAHDRGCGELETANEEILSFNEELQSTNEELETAKEELQSGNEELTTINDELGQRNQDLNRANDDLANFIASADIPIVVVGPDLRVRRFSPAAERVLRLITSDAGRPIGDLQLPLEVDDLAAIVRRVIATREPYEREIRSRDGRWTSLRMRPYLTQDGRVDGSVLALIDIHDLKLHELVVESARERLQATIDTIREPFLVLDSKLRVESTNDAFTKVFLLDRGAVVGRPFFKIDGGQWDLPDLRRRLRDLKEDGVAFDGVEIELDFARIGPRVMRLNARHLRATPGHGAHILLAFWDVTTPVLQRRSDAHKLASALDSNAAKDVFLAILSHELRTPLNSILGWTQLLISGALDSQRSADALIAIQRGGRAQAALIEDLLDVSRIISGKMRVHLVATDLAAEVDAAVEGLRPDAEAKGIELVASIDPSAGPVATDPRRFPQILRNLIQNAVKFTARGGHVRVRVERGEESAVITVEDDGIGIDPEYLPHVFDRFEQADNTTTRRQAGLGLGLAISQHLAGLHGGTLRAASPGVGLGSAFTLTLPLAGAGALRVANVEAGGDRTPVDLSGVRALVVDDDADSLLFASTVLRGAGAEVSAFDNVADALAAWSDAQPAIVLTDIAMPARDGYSFLRAIRTMAATGGGRVPVLALSAAAGAGDVEAALGAGFDAHLAKPIEAGSLARSVASLVRR